MCDMSGMICWTWSKPGETLLKSAKIIKENNKQQKPLIDEFPKQQKYYTGFIEQNKREEGYKKLAQRHLMTNSKINPFHIKNNYVKDISVQDTFLRPKDSNQE